MPTIRVHLHTATHRVARAFTLVEVMAVVVVIGILAATALPALDRLGDTRAAAALDAIEGEAVFARSLAMAGHTSAGLRVDVASQQVAAITRGGASGVIGASDAMGAARAPLEIDHAYPGAAIASFTGPAAAERAGAIWFAHDGTPEIRDASGAFIESAATDCVITMAGGATVTINAGGGAIVVAHTGVGG